MCRILLPRSLRLGPSSHTVMNLINTGFAFIWTLFVCIKRPMGRSGGWPSLVREPCDISFPRSASAIVRGEEPALTFGPGWWCGVRGRPRGHWTLSRFLGNGRNQAGPRRAGTAWGHFPACCPCIGLWSAVLAPRGVLVWKTVQRALSVLCLCVWTV